MAETLYAEVGTDNVVIRVAVFDPGTTAEDARATQGIVPCGKCEACQKAVESGSRDQQRQVCEDPQSQWIETKTDGSKGKHAGLGDRFDTKDQKFVVPTAKADVMAEDAIKGEP